MFPIMYMQLLDVQQATHTAFDWPNHQKLHCFKIQIMLGYEMKKVLVRMVADYGSSNWLIQLNIVRPTHCSTSHYIWRKLYDKEQLMKADPGFIIICDITQFM